MRKLRSVLQTAERLPVHQAFAGRQSSLQHLPDSPAELQEIPKNRIGIYHSGDVRLQVRVRPALLCAHYRCFRGITALPTNSNIIKIPIIEIMRSMYTVL